MTKMNKILLCCAAALSLNFSPTAYGSVIYVSTDGTGSGTSWADATADLQSAIDNASAGDQIWIAGGTYKPSRLIKSTKSTSRAFFLKDGVSLYGGFSGTETATDGRACGDKHWEMEAVTILDGDDDTPDTWTRQIDPATTYRWTFATENNQVPGTKGNASHVLYCETEFTHPTYIDGVTIKGGNANVYQAKAAGGAVYALGSVHLANCIITENSAYFSVESTTNSDTMGGAVYMKGNGSVTGCLFKDNYSHSAYGNGLGGAIYSEGASISGCEFRSCVGLDMGGAVYMSGGSLNDCLFYGCYGSAGGAVYIASGTASDLRAIDCRALNGGAVYSCGTLKHLQAYQCYADAPEFGEALGGRGGAMFIASGSATGCVLTNNEAFKGGGVYIAATGKLVNSTIQNNKIRYDSQDLTNVATEGTSATVANTIHSCLTDLSNFVAPTDYDGRATLETIPEDIEQGDWQLAPGSEFIDTGEHTEGFADGNDPAGNPRISGAGIDTGAFEYQHPQAELPSVILTFADGTTSARIGTGGASGYEFFIDWGNGEKVSYTSQAYITHAITGNTVKIYGDVILVRAASQGVTAADFSNSQAMVQIMLGQNPMTTLTLGNHPSLTGLYAEQCRIGSIDVTGCPALKVLDLHENEISGTVDCSSMSALSKIDVADNKISSLILPKHNTLYEVDASGNLLQSVDIAGRAGVTEIALSGNSLKSVDLSGLTSLEALYLDGNALTTLDISPCTALEKIVASENLLTGIDLSKNKSLTGVYLQNNRLSAIDVTANPSVRWLNVGNNLIEHLDLSAQPYLSILIANGNRLSAIDLTGKSNISSLDLSDNRIATLDISSSGYLSQCHVENNLLESLDTSSNPYLYGLFCSNNRIAGLDLSKNTYLQRLEAAGNRLTMLDVTANGGLQSVFVQSNLMHTAQIDELIAGLPDVSSVSVTPETSFLRQLDVSDMPGTSEANIAAAQAKGWTVKADDAGVDTPISDGNKEIVSVRCYDLLGRPTDTDNEGIALRVTTYSDGSRQTVKTICGK